ncbi:MAG: hypothetical protein J5590_09965 [Clostridia bacterium]|nr:hypothetical protein [Clostridia bacterium]
MSDLHKNYQMLARAIVVQAIKDYRYSGNDEVRKSIEEFFRSGYFSLLCDYDGNELIRKLRRERLMKIG